MTAQLLTCQIATVITTPSARRPRYQCTRNCVNPRCAHSLTHIALVTTVLTSMPGPLEVGGNIRITKVPIHSRRHAMATRSTTSTGSQSGSSANSIPMDSTHTRIGGADQIALTQSNNEILRRVSTGSHTPVPIPKKPAMPPTAAELASGASPAFTRAAADHDRHMSEAGAASASGKHMYTRTATPIASAGRDRRA